MQSTLAVLCPFTPRISPHADLVQRWSLQWATRHGLLDRPGARAAFATARFANLIARACPTAGPADLKLATGWLITIFALDDQLERAGDADRARAVADAVLAQLGTPTAETRPGTTAAETQHGTPAAEPSKGPLRALSDVWARTRSRVSPAWRARFVGHVGDYLDATVWEAGNRAAHRPPPVDEYRRMRHSTAAVEMFFDLMEPMHAFELPAGLLTDPDFATMRDTAGMITAFFNDIVSWPKEAAAGDQHNLVLALSHERSLTLEAAVTAAVAEHDTLVLRFMAARQRFAEGPWAADPAVEAVAADFVHWVRGNVDWSMESGRYIAPEARIPAQRHAAD